MAEERALWQQRMEGCTGECRGARTRSILQLQHLFPTTSTDAPSIAILKLLSTSPALLPLQQSFRHLLSANNSSRELRIQQLQSKPLLPTFRHACSPLHCAILPPNDSPLSRYRQLTGCKDTTSTAPTCIDSPRTASSNGPVSGQPLRQPHPISVTLETGRQIKTSRPTRSNAPPSPRASAPLPSPHPSPC